MSGLPWRPIITYDTPTTTIALQWPQKLWDYETQLVGGSRKSTSGIPEAFALREDNCAIVTLRVHDCEYMAMRKFVTTLQRNPGLTFTFQFDADDPVSVFTCYLDSPSLEEGYKPKRDTAWPNCWLFTMKIRSTNGVPIFYSMAQQCAIDSTSVAPFTWVISDLDASALPYGAGRKIISLTGAPPDFPPGGSILDPSASDGSDFTPAGWDTDGVYRSINPLVEWITRPLSAGYLIPTYGQLMGNTSGSPSTDWLLMDAIVSLHHLRAGAIIASSDEEVCSFGWLGGESLDSYPVSSIGALEIEDNDQLLIKAWSRYSPKPGGDHSGRLFLSWGSVFGPWPTTFLIGSGNVTEL